MINISTHSIFVSYFTALIGSINHIDEKNIYVLWDVNSLSSFQFRSCTQCINHIKVPQNVIFKRVTNLGRLMIIQLVEICSSLTFLSETEDMAQELSCGFAKLGPQLKSVSFTFGFSEPFALIANVQQNRIVLNKLSTLHHLHIHLHH